MIIALDLNVVLDVVQNRQPHYQDSAEVLSRIRIGEIAALLPSHGVTTLWYLLDKAANPATANQTVDWLLNHFEIGATDKAAFQTARRLPIPDFEDAVVTSLARSANSDYIVTRNVADFAGSPVPAITPTESLKLLPAPTPPAAPETPGET